MSYLTKDIDSPIALLLPDASSERSGQNRWHDEEFWPQGKSPDDHNYPAITAPVTSRNGIEFPRKELPKEMMVFARDLNLQNSIEAMLKIFEPATGWINSGAGQKIDPLDIENLTDKDMPQVDVVTTVGNFVQVLDFGGDRDNPRWIKAKTLRPDDVLKSGEVNYRTAALFVHAFMSADKHNRLGLISSGGKTDDGEHCYIPFVSPHGEVYFRKRDAWNDIQRIEILPQPPFDVTVTNWFGLSVRTTPEVPFYSHEKNKVGGLRYRNSVTVEKYFIGWDGVWGKIQSGWINLCYKLHPNYQDVAYYTSWRMKGVPALRPDFYIPGRLGGLTKQDAINRIWNYYDVPGLVGDRGGFYEGPELP